MTQTKAELLETKHQGDIRLGDANSSHYVGFKAPATVASSLVWTLPAADGSANQFLQTNASGVLSWGTADTSASMPLTGGTFTGAVNFGDDVKARFGNGNDLEIYHNSSNNNSIIAETGSGIFSLQSNGSQISFYDIANSVIMAEFNTGGSCSFKHGANVRLNTTSTGVAVTGALTVSTNATITGDLTVSGTTTTINTQTLDVEDKNVVIGKVSSPSDTTADGGGWTLKGASDKTFNWVNATDAWTSSEHIHLIDNKKLFVGGASGTTDGLEIFHDSNNSFIKDSGTGGLFIQGSGGGAGITLEDPDGNNFIVCIDEGTGGTVELYKGGSKKLETTTGGINVTGAINVNGSALSTAPQITATTDGALTAGDAVIVKTDGEVTKVAPSFVESDPYTTPDATGVEMVSTDVEDCQVIYDEALSTSLSKLIFWIAYRNQNSSDQIWLGSYNATDNSFDSSPSNAFGGGVPYGNAYDTVNDKLLFTYRNASGNYTLSSVTTSGISSFTVEASNMMVNIGTEKPWIGIAYVGSSKAVWVGPESATNGIARVITIASNGGLTHSSGHNVSVDSGQLKYMRVAGSGNQIVVAYAKAIDSDHGYCRVGTISGTSISFGSETEFANERCDDIRIGYDSVSGKYLFFYGYNPGKVRVGTVSGTNISFGTAVNISTGAISDGSDKGFGSMKYNVKTGTFTIAYLDTSFGRRIQTRGATISGTSVTLNTSLDTSQYTTNKGFDVAVGYLSDTVFGSFLAYRYNTGKLRGQELVTMSLGTNLTTENFIGFAAAGASDNATATIDVSGATNSNQSSLTAGQKYFVQTNGSLGLTAATPKVFAGTAISATKLIVNDQAPPTAGWTVINSEYIQTGHTSDPIISESLSSAYKMYRVQFYFVFASSGLLGLRIKHGGSWQTSNYWYQTHRASGGSVEDGYANNNANRLYAGASRMGRIINGSITFGNVHSTNQHKTFSMVTGMASELINGWATNTFVDHSFGGHNSTAAVTGLRFHCSALSEGWFVLEGLAI